MKNYLITIFSSQESEEAWARMSPQEMQSHLKRYMDYSQRLRDEGRLVAAEGLSQHGALLSKVSGKLEVTDGPYVFAKEMVGGFFYITANSLDEAIRIAQDCPALEAAGRVEVREQMDYGD